MTIRSRRLAAHRGTWITALAAVCAFAGACVGSEGGGGTWVAQRADADVSAEEPRAPVVSDGVTPSGPGVAYREDVAALDYKIFEQAVLSASPRKTLHRLLVMFPESGERLSKTARVALDSIAAADTTVVAARVIVYAFRPSGPNEGEVIPVVWGEWVPAEGWAKAGPDSRRRWHRTYVYLGAPPWSEDDVGGVPEADQR